MNYQPDVLDHVFTLAHEAGPFDAQLLLGEASAVSVLQLHDFRRGGGQHVQRAALARHMMAKAKSDKRAGLSDQPPDRRHPRHDHPPDDVRRVRKNHSRTGRSRRAADGGYRCAANIASCSISISAPISSIDKELELECLRIPHFYRAFYVYKYATGLERRDRPEPSACSTAARQELNDYLGFLKGGCSKYPLDLLRGAGVDMEKPPRRRRRDEVLWRTRRGVGRIALTYHGLPARVFESSTGW